MFPADPGFLLNTILVKSRHHSITSSRSGGDRHPRNRRCFFLPLTAAPFGPGALPDKPVIPFEAIAQSSFGLHEHVLHILEYQKLFTRRLVKTELIRDDPFRDEGVIFQQLLEEASSCVGVAPNPQKDVQDHTVDTHSFTLERYPRRTRAQCCFSVHCRQNCRQTAVHNSKNKYDREKSLSCLTWYRRWDLNPYTLAGEKPLKLTAKLGLE
jgi:hypothetical protein